MNSRLLLALVLTGVTSIAAARDAEIEYYDIDGNSARDLREQMNALGPVDELDGETYDAHTRWNVNWNFRFEPTEDGCELSEIDVTVHGTITLPRWVGRDAGPGALVDRWDAFEAALQEHEDGHYAHGVDAAAEIEALGQGFSNFDCDTIDEDFNQRANQVIAKYNQADLDYDAQTDHGGTQGATFP